MKKMNIDDILKVTIEKQDHFGSGITKTENGLIFVKNGLPGDELIIRIIKVKKNYSVGRIEKIVCPSKMRVIPECPFYHQCGGCQIMHQDYSSQLLLKKQKVKELFSKFCQLDVPIENIISGDKFHYRNKVVFHGDNGQLGYFQEETNSLVPIEQCLLVHPKINDLYKTILDLTKSHSFFIKQMMIRYTQIGEMMLVIEGNGDITALVSGIKDQFQSFYFNKKLLFGHPFIEEEIKQLRFQILPKSFFQVNYEMMLQLYQMTYDFLQDKNYHHLLDLYCGTGTIGLLLAELCEKVTGIEVCEEAIAAAKNNQEFNRISNIEFILGRVEDHISSFQNVDAIVVDPPRNGLDSKTREIILKLKPERIVYISCDPVTLTRDLKILFDEYELTKIQVVDMFPNTYHVETVSLLSKLRTDQY